MNLDIKHFKNELSDYYYLKYKLQRIEDLKLELDVRRGVSAIRYDKESTQGSCDPLTIQLKKLDDIDKAEYLENELIKYSTRLNRITDFLKQAEHGEQILKIHCTSESTYDIESKKMFVSSRTLKRIVNQEILNYLGGVNEGR